MRSASEQPRTSQPARGAPPLTTKPSRPKNFQHPLFASFHLNSRHSEFLHHKETHFVYLKKKAKKIMSAAREETAGLELDQNEIESNWDEIVDNFDNMNLSPELLRGIYAYGFERPSTIQQRAILPVIKGHDVISPEVGPLQPPVPGPHPRPHPRVGPADPEGRHCPR
ncbi:hypothetical protein K457DRAFT_441199 [Linnemannia elongata AG-77]|uniref:DEAD-box RNA helicase Q domain-containing protein n=1 Tax=Linnemannia elongata AG-77 TaxID=1314771 RepID=A0A197JZ95_9FUNG|nr:hypothetical protein K457DRAFT_441199 [Linnemannia elongata AG-77]